MSDRRTPAPMPFVGRDRTLDLVRDLLFASGADVDVVGSRQSGRTSVIDAIAATEADAQRTILRVNGIPGLHTSPLAALHAGGFSGGQAHERRASPLQQAIDTLTRAVGQGRTAILVDDADLLDTASAGAVAAVSRSTGVPVLRTRTRTRTAPRTRAYTVELEPLGFEHLRTALAARLGSPLDPGAMSGVYALTGGNVGLALALIDVAVLEGRLVPAAGAWSAVKDLWSASLHGMLQAHLADLERVDRDALTAVAAAGVRDADVLRGLIGPAAIEGLEAHGVLRTVPHAGRPLFAFDPPALARLLRDERRPPRTPAAQGRSDTLFLESVRSAADDRRAAAASDWEFSPSAETALAFARALMPGTGIEPGTETALDAVLRAAPDIGGPPLAVAELAALAARRSVSTGRPLAAVVSRLRECVAGLGAYERIADAAAAQLALELGASPADVGAALADDPGLSAEVRARVLESAQAAALREGRFLDAVDLFGRLCGLAGVTVTANARAAHACALLGAGRHAEAVERAIRGADEARERLDAGALRAHTIVLGLCRLIADRPADAADALATASALGASVLPSSTTQVAVRVLTALCAVRRGDPALAERTRDELAALRENRSAAPGMSAVRLGVRWIDAQLTAGRGRPAEAAVALRSLAAALAQRGELALAAVALLTALEHSRDDDDLAEARALLARQQSELHDAQLAALVDRAHPESARPGSTHGNTQTAALAARLAATGRATPGAAGAFFSTPIALTQRESEIARFVAQGLSNPQIATRLVLSVRTVESHVSRIMRKTSAANRAQLAEIAARLAL